MLTGKLLSEIGKIYASQDKEGLELEARFGFYSQGVFKSTVHYAHFQRLLSELRNNKDYDREILEESTVAIDNNVRRITTINKTDSPSLETVVWERKTNISNTDVEEYGMRISFSREQPVPAPKSFQPKVLRTRTRHKFLSKDGIAQVDLTEVMMSASSKVANPKTMRSSFEVEVEFKGRKDELPIFGRHLEDVFKMLKGTRNIYTDNVYNSLIRDISKILEPREKGYGIDKDVLVEARNIKKADIVYGGIVGNPDTSYVVTFKADGLRKMLIIHHTGIWLVYPPKEYNLLLLASSSPAVKHIAEQFSGIVLDGELIDGTPLYLAFDCLSFIGTATGGKKIPANIYIQQQPYPVRRKAVEGIVNVINKAASADVLSVQTKEIAYLDDYETFFDTMGKFLDMRAELPYEEDGLIFTPVNTVYNPKSQDLKVTYDRQGRKKIIKRPLKDRVLTRLPDVCKWKEAKQLTIDFALNWFINSRGEKDLQLLAYDDVAGKMVPFTGDRTHPLAPEMIDKDNELTINAPVDTVVEYEWIDALGLFRPYRIRHDKPGPNRLSVALTNWADIMDPITAEDLRGNTLAFVFPYHNRIKRLLYDTMEKGSNILDIGSGRGGDIGKWISLQDRTQKDPTGLIVAVEPNDDNREELVRRLRTYKMGQRVEVVATGGEDTVGITEAVKSFVKKRVDAITLMLSLSFFWQSGYHLEALINTVIYNVKPGGRVYYFTIDGDAVEELFEEVGDDDIEISTARMHIYPKPDDPFYGRPLDFTLYKSVGKASIVGEKQREYIVYLADLTERLAEYGFVMTEKLPATDEMLSETAKLYSSLYSYGWYQHDGVTPFPNDQPVNIDLENIILPEPELAPEIVVDETTGVASLSKGQDVPVAETINVRSKVISESLPMLSVSFRTSDGYIRDDLAIGDDSYEPLVDPSGLDLVRIACIGDGSCFIHATLKAMCTMYQEVPSAAYRIELCQKTRRDLAQALSYDNPKYPEHSYWETISQGSYPRMVMQQIHDEDLVGELGVDYSLTGLQRLLNSTEYLGDETYPIVAEILGINIYVLRATVDGLQPNMRMRTGQGQTIIIAGNDVHFEVVAVDNGSEFQTVFTDNDPIIMYLDGIFGGREEVQTYDPDVSFAEDILSMFTVNGQFEIPEKVWDIFDEEDVFITMIEKVRDTLQ